MLMKCNNKWDCSYVGDVLCDKFENVCVRGYIERIWREI